MSSSAQKKKMQAVRGGKKEKKDPETLTEEEKKHEAKKDKIKAANRARKEKYKEMTTDSPVVSPTGKGTNPYDESEEVNHGDSNNDWRNIGSKGIKDDKGCSCAIS